MSNNTVAGETGTPLNGNQTTNSAELTPLIDAGYELIPLRQRGKAPIQTNWVTRPHNSSQQIKHMDDGGNVGVRLRATDLVIDVDPRNFEDTWGETDPFTEFVLQLGFDPDAYPLVETGGGGFHYYMKKPADISIVDSLKKFPGVEFKTIARQVVAPGSIHPSGKPYKWDFLTEDFANTPAAPNSLIDLIRRPAATSVTGGGEIDNEQLAVMLATLDPEDFSNQDNWLNLMMACHHATGGDGKSKFIEWSTRDPAYSDHDEIIGRRWDSLNVDNDGSARVTYGTLCKIVREHGDPASIPVRNVGDDFVEPIDRGSIPSSTETKPPVYAIIDEMNKTFCAVLDGGSFQICREDIDTTFDRKVWSKMSREAFRHYFEDETLKLTDSSKPISKADVWLKSPKRRKYRGLIMDPQGLPENSDKLNLWKGWSEEPKAGDWSLMEELIGDVLCDGNSEAENYVRRWIAFMLQKPWETPEAAIAFRGEEGTGKGTLGRALMHIAGAHGLTVSSRNQFAGRFNSHLRNCIFLFADEAFWPGDKEGEGILKQLITEPVISYEAKGKDLVSGRNMVHLMLASNEEWIVPAGKEARRFFVSDVSNKYRGDQNFFGRLWKQMANGGYAAMVHDLMAIDLTGWRPTMSIPQTEALADQKVQSLDAPSKFWFDLLNKGDLPIGFSADGDEIDWSLADVELGPKLKDQMLSAYDDFLKRSRIMSVRATHKALTASGRRYGLITGKSKGSQDRVWVLPRLSEMRAKFEKAIGAKEGLFD